MRAPALLSDLDGVLVDSTASVDRAWRSWAERNGLAYDDFAHRIHGVPSRRTIAAVAPHLDAADESRLLDSVQADDAGDVVAMPGARDLLRNGFGAQVAIVTSCNDRLARARLGAAGITPPAVMVTSDHVTHGKPDPEPYLLGASLLGLDPRSCVVIEDAPAGIAAGKAAGMRVVALLTTHDEADLHEADDIVADLRALPELLGR